MRERTRRQRRCPKTDRFSSGGMRRPGDILVQGHNGSECTLFDIGVTSSLCKQNPPKCSEDALASADDVIPAAAHYEETKFREFEKDRDELLRRFGDGAQFSPLIWEAHGGATVRASDLLVQLANRLHQHDRTFWRRDLATTLCNVRRRVSIAIARWNARMIVTQMAT